MIKLAMRLGDRATLFLGLSLENSAKLHKDMPIVVNIEQLRAEAKCPEFQDIIILAGDTEQSILEHMVENFGPQFEAAIADAVATGRVHEDMYYPNQSD